jgi:hypothetical protein
VCTYTTVGAEFDPTGMIDNCGITFSGTNPANSIDGTNTLSAEVFPLGITVVTWTVTDINTNTNTCLFSVTVIDEEVPFISCAAVSPPGPIDFNECPGVYPACVDACFTVNVAPGTCGQTVTWYRPSPLTHTFFDNCGMDPLNPVTEEQPIMPDGLPYPISSFNPTFPLPADFFVDEGVTPYPYDEFNPLHYLTPVSAEFPVGTTVLRYYFWDVNGNYDSIKVTVTVIENQPPMAVCQPSLLLPLDATGNATVTAAAINNGSSDNCGILSMMPLPPTFTCANVGLNIVTLKVTDFAGNTATCTTSVTVTDNLAPVVNCPNDIVTSTDAGVCTTTAASIAGLGMTEITPPSTPLSGPGQYKDNCGVVSVDWELTGVTVAGPFNVALPAAMIIPGAQVFNKGVTFVTYTFYDAAGNSTTCSFDVTVSDLVAPTTLNCPPNVTINANTGGCIGSHTWTVPTWTDNCPGAISVVPAHTQGSMQTQFFFFGPNTVTYTATDLAGNVGNCTFTVNVQDLQAPVANCKNINVSLGAGGTVTVTASQVDNGSTDNCFYAYDPTNLAWTFDCTNMGVNMRTLSIKDGQGNTASCTASITVKDSIIGIKDPMITDCASVFPSAVNLDVNCEGTLDANVYGTNFTVTDNTQLAGFCPLTYEVNVQDPDGNNSGYVSTYPWTCVNAGVNIVTFRVTDVFGNTTICTKNITVNDVTDPIIIAANTIAPPVVNVECDLFDLSDFATLGQITLADVQDACDDDCNEAISVSFFDVFLGLNGCPNAFSFLRTWVVTDQAGNTTTHTQTLNSVDTDPPTFNVPTQIFNLDANNQDDSPACVAPFTVALLDGQIIDNCTPPLVSFFDVFYEIQFPSGPPTGLISGASVTTDFPIGTSTVTFDVYDECGNFNQIVFTVNVNDVNGPIVNEPFGFFFGNSQLVCDSTFVVLNATGNCGNNFSWYRPYLQGLDFLDCSGHTVTEAISDPTVQSAINVSAPFQYNNPPIFSIHPTTFFPVGMTMVTYTATDIPTGNTTTCKFTVKVVDTQGPDINCPSNQNLSISSGCVSVTTVPNYLNGVQVTDNCPNNIVLTQVPAAGTLLSMAGLMPPGPVQAGQTFTVKIKATDGQMNNLADSCTFTVTLFDGNAPVPDVPILPTITSFCGKDTVDAPSATDCDGVMFVTIYGTPSVTVLGILPPLVPGGPPRYIIPAGNYAITWSYTDPQMNTTTQLQSVNIFVDNIPPIAQCKPPFSINLSAAGDYALSVTELDNGSFDQHNCGPVMLSLNPTILTCANINASANVALNVKDVAGNVATCVTPVTVFDITAPVLSPIPANTTLEACATIPNPPTITAADACGGITITYLQDTTSFTNAYKYTIRRTWTAKDGSLNSSTGVQFITIQDTLAPVFANNTPDTICVITDLNNLNCFDTVAFDVTPFVDDCDSTTLTITNTRTGQGANYFEILSAGTYTLQFTAKDGNNNSSTHVIIVIVKDGTNPIAACINGISVALQSSGTVTVTSANIDANSSDNCTDDEDLDLKIQRLDPLGPISIAITYNCADADGVTQHPVKLYVKDEAGNESTCETYVIVQDNVFPQITSCPPNKTLQCTDDISPTLHGAPTATDNCSIDTIDYVDVVVPDSGSVCYKIVRTWEVYDQANNLTTCVQTFNVQDTLAPVLSSYAPDDTISCSQGLPPAAVVTATDNCSQNVVVQFEQDTIDLASGPCGQFAYTIVRTRTAVDDCGNAEVHVRKIKIVDNEIPQFLGMPDTIVVKSADYPPNAGCTVPVTLDISQYLNDCAPDSIITLVHNAPFGSGTADISGDYLVGNYTIKFTATDPCGNMNMDSIVIMVMDNSIPTVVCNDNVVISLGTNGEATISPDDIDLGSIDNCDIDTMILSQSTFDCTDLGDNPDTLTVIDVNGNSNFCAVTVKVTLGMNAGFSLTTVGTPESYFGADDGTATATATGGSGGFSYTWSNGGTTSMLTGLAAGTYTVTVVDTLSGCLQVDTAIILEGAKITLSVGSGDGCTGQILSLPVTVDNFINVTGFQFTLHPNDASVGTILGITAGSVDSTIAAELDANLLAGNNLGIFWFDTSLTLPNGTVLFSIDIQLGSAAVGATTPVVVTGTPVSLQFTQDSSGVSVVTGMVNIVNGSIEITCGMPDLEIGGDIQTWNNPQPVPGVEVSLTGGVTANQTTGLPGTYLFGIPDNINTTVDCDKVTAGNSGLTGADVLLIKRHVLVIQQLTSPYQYVAADVSGEGNLSLIDYARIQQVALGLLDHITGSPDWKFVPKSYVFPTPPLSVLPIPQSISHTPANMDFIDDDFVAVRMGDVNGSVVPNFTSDDDVFDRSETFLFQVDERNFQAGETVEVPFKATNFNDRSGWQMTLNFDPNVFELEGIVPGVLPEMGDANFGTMRLDEGQLTTLWVTPEPMTIADGEVLFTLKFKALRNGGSLAEVLRPGSNITRAEAYDRDGNTMKLDFEFVQPQTGAEAASFALYQNQPNPFNDLTVIGFRLPESGRASFRVFNASGQLVKTVVGGFEKGYNELNFRRDDFGAAGVYYYELETAKNSDRKKMILID